MGVLRAGLCPGLTQDMVQLLQSRGIKTVVDLVSADLEEVAQKCGLSYKALVALRRVLLAQFSAFPFNGADLYEELKTSTAILSTGIGRYVFVWQQTWPMACSRTSSTLIPTEGSQPPASSSCFRPGPWTRRSRQELSRGSRWCVRLASSRCWACCRTCAALCPNRLGLDDAAGARAEDLGPGPQCGSAGDQSHDPRQGQRAAQTCPGTLLELCAQHPDSPGQHPRLRISGQPACGVSDQIPPSANRLPGDGGLRELGDPSVPGRSQRTVEAEPSVPGKSHMMVLLMGEGTGRKAPNSPAQ
ncbi:DNA repair protein RAD51 homolog 4 isoform X7 [Moschus berezovskii]|uniref:DNA repair protein RAD51 homolog 4 isoform X7 n=1 Tax=Moschus berezovskii TaxID=68408 RepID=UPI0024442B95|nr:DNA repair protein RAD51 homolog 4 isoform X7 [Moschus berezovskii]